MTSHVKLNGREMKTLLGIVTLILILTVSTVEAQFLRSYGIKAGPVRAEQKWDYAPHTGSDDSWISPVWGIDAGVFAEFFDSGYFSLLTELHFVQRGCTFTIQRTIPADNPQGYIDLGPEEMKQRCDYLSLPVMAKLRLETGVATPYIAVGPRFEFLISNPSSVVFDNFKKFEFAATAAAGVEIDAGFTPKLLCEVSYTMGLADSFKNDNLTVKNRSLSLLVGVQF